MVNTTHITFIDKVNNVYRSKLRSNKHQSYFSGVYSVPNDAQIENKTKRIIN